MPDYPSSIAAAFDDPRISPTFVRTGENLLLIGVVHDHPASIARVSTLLEAAPPDILALELPSVAVPLYRSYASESRWPPRVGGEMSAGIARAPGAKVVGIDGPNWLFLRRLLARLVAERVPFQTARTLIKSVVSASREALTCRLAATVCSVTSLTVIAQSPIEYDCKITDSPTKQATHEQAHLSAVRTLLAGGDRPTVRYRDETREACMIDRLEGLRSQGTVAAIVGVHHLDSLEVGIAEGGD